ncbi:NAD(P)-binding domain-containing protein [Tabrizicola sp. KVB23]|uniref:NAD(P)-binding domain-containing protein n=2 Tax=Fuscibacter oryzae TaxID=2803939 RepID=A0A8J7MSV9_9RHOB|nr:NAD(P)-binding domain-containing protein [Fuscibacter oryzae]
MKIAIIGTGGIGAGLASVLANGKNEVTVSDRKGGADAAAKLAGRGVLVRAAEVRPAVAAADVVILAVPYGAAAGLAEVADFAGKIVVDVTNPVKEDFSGLLVGHTTSAAEEIARALTGAKLVKAFNTVFAQVYDQGLIFGATPVQTFVAADDGHAKAAVIALAQEAGFDVRDAGPLSNARHIEPLAYLNIQFGYMLGQGTQIAPVWLSR